MNVTERVVVGVDGSGPARQAAAWAAQEADLRGAPLGIAHVLGCVPPVPSSESDDVLRRCAAVARIAAPDLAVEARTWFGEPTEVLHRLGLRAGLLVVGHHGAGRVTPGVGSTAARLARHRPAALAVVRRAPGRPLPDRGLPVVVGVDGGPGSAALARHGAWLASVRGAELSLVHVWHEHLTRAVERLTHREKVSFRQRAEAAMAQLAGQLAVERPGLAIRTGVERGRPAWALLEHSDDAQLVLVGRHRGAGTGSCASALLQSAACPVLIVDPHGLARPAPPPTHDLTEAR